MSKPTEYKKAISRLLKLHKCVVPKRSRLPILQRVRLFERNNRLVIQSTDLEQRLETATPAFAEAGFAFVVKLETLEAYLSFYAGWPAFHTGKSASSSSVTMAEMHHEGEVDRIFPDFADDEFPHFEFNELGIGTSLSTGDIEKLKSLLAFTSDLSISISGVHLDNDKAVSTDGGILAYVDLEADTRSDVTLTPAIVKFMNKLEGTIEFGANDEQIFIRANGVAYEAKRSLGNYPDWKKIIPTGEPAVRLDFDRKTVAELINGRKKQFAAVNNSLKPEYVCFGLCEDRIVFVLSNEKTAEPKDDFPGEVAGGAYEAARLKTEHLEKILKLSGDRIELRFYTEKEINKSFELDASGASLVLGEFTDGVYKGLFRLILT